MTWEQAPISNEEPFLYGINKEKNLKFYSISRQREMIEMEKNEVGTLYSSSLNYRGK